MRCIILPVLLLAAAACSRDATSSSSASNVAGEPARHYGLGRAATSASTKPKYSASESGRFR